jgi:uncharacterized UBP type Zn finger protein
MQVLKAVPEFAKPLVECSIEHPLISGLRKIILALNSPGGISRNHLMEALREIYGFWRKPFDVNYQDDVRLFMGECLHDLNEIFSSDSTGRGIADCFQFRWRRMFRPDSPVHALDADSLQQEIFLPIKMVSENSGFMQALRNFSAPGHMLWQLGNGVEIDMTVHNRIENFPRVFLIAVERFIDRSDGSVGKDNRPMSLPLKFYFPQEAMARPHLVECELIGVLAHFGRTSESGHYIAYIRTDGGFWEFNDSRVRWMSNEEAQEAFATGSRMVVVRCREIEQE